MLGYQYLLPKLLDITASSGMITNTPWENQQCTYWEEHTTANWEAWLASPNRCLIWEEFQCNHWEDLTTTAWEEARINTSTCLTWNTVITNWEGLTANNWEIII